MFFSIRAFQGPGFLGFRIFRVLVQVLEVAVWICADIFMIKMLYILCNNFFSAITEKPWQNVLHNKTIPS